MSRSDIIHTLLDELEALYGYLAHIKETLPPDGKAQLEETRGKIDRYRQDYPKEEE